MKKKISAISISIISLGLITVILTLPVLNNVTFIEIIKKLFPLFSEVHKIFSDQGSVSTTSFICLLFVFVILSFELMFLLLILIRSLFASAMRNQYIKVFGKSTIILITSLILVFFSYFYNNLVHINLPHILNKAVEILTSIKISNTFYGIISLHIVIMTIEAIRRIEIRNNPDERKSEVISMDNFLKYESNNLDDLALETYIDCNKFSLGLLKFGLTLFTVVTLGFGLSYSLVKYRKFYLDHTVFESKKYSFDCTYKMMFVKLLKWGFLSVITLGIYLFVIEHEYKEFVLKHTHRKG